VKTTERSFETSKMVFVPSKPILQCHCWIMKCHCLVSFHVDFKSNKQEVLHTNGLTLSHVLTGRCNEERTRYT